MKKNKTTDEFYFWLSLITVASTNSAITLELCLVNKKLTNKGFLRVIGQSCIEVTFPALSSHFACENPLKLKGLLPLHC